MSTSNTKDCIRELIGKRIVGVMFDALPVNHGDLQAGNKTLVFEDGTGFTFSSKNGAFWRETAESITRAIRVQEEKLRANQRDIEDVLALAGAKSEQDNP